MLARSIYFCAHFLLILGSPNAFADDSGGDTPDRSTVRLDPIPVFAPGSFESLSDDTFLPQKKVSFTGQDQHGTTIDTLSKQEIFPTTNFGYPSGATTVSTGGRSSNDTQAFTLGVPLNLPQGGGPDLSIFPNFLWSGAILSPGLSAAAFTPQAASGSLQLIPWSREKLRENGQRASAALSRFTATYDRDIQTFALGTKKENLAILLGGTTGLESGPAGELSYDLLNTSQNHLLFHVIGTEQKGNSPGSIQAPAPLATKNVWRVIPVLESHQELEGNVILENTLYVDFQSLVYQNPAANAFNQSSDDRTEQYGMENALMVGPYTFALSARYLNYTNSSISTSGINHIQAQDWPSFASATRDFFLSDLWTAKLTANITAQHSTSLAPGGKIAVKREIDSHQYFFSELNTVDKLPSVLDRYATYGDYYHGNPNLKPERVNAFLIGFDLKSKEIEATTTLKAEYRNQIQYFYSDPVTFQGTELNGGDAELIYLQQNLNWQFHPQFKLSAITLLTGSKVKDTQLSYPDLPFFSQQLGLDYTPSDRFGFSVLGKYVGPSVEGFGAFHPDYVLADFSASYLYTKDFRFTAGIENLFDNRAQVVLGYPLPGREVFLSMQTNF